MSKRNQILFAIPNEPGWIRTIDHRVKISERIELSNSRQPLQKPQLGTLTAELRSQIPEVGIEPTRMTPLLRGPHIPILLLRQKVRDVNQTSRVPICICIIIPVLSGGEIQCCSLTISSQIG